MDQIITSPLQQDAYKFSMGNFIWTNFPNVTAKFSFQCRDNNLNLGRLRDEVHAELMALDGLGLKSSDVNYLKTWRYLNDGYIRFLSEEFRYDANRVEIYADGRDLRIETDGTWQQTSMWELPILAVVSAVNTRRWLIENNISRESMERDGLRILRDNLSLVGQYPRLQFADFCFRRAVDPIWHERVLLEVLRLAPQQLTGTSNVYLANSMGLLQIGTMAHELFMAMLSLAPRVELAQPWTLYLWLQVFKDKLGIALTDTFTSKAFFHDFDIVLSRAFDGVRHDSGNAYAFADRLIQHYKKLGIDPRMKTCIWTNSVTFRLMIDLWKTFVGRVGVGFGIGNQLGHNVGVVPYPNIVMKIVECNGRKTCKLSDDAGKMTGDTVIAQSIIDAYKGVHGVDLGVTMKLGGYNE